MELPIPLQRSRPCALRLQATVNARLMPADHSHHGSQVFGGNDIIAMCHRCWLKIQAQQKAI
ncbi:MAG: hypothetical protein ACLS43_06935 [Evtepia gabavorous]